MVSKPKTQDMFELISVVILILAMFGAFTYVAWIAFVSLAGFDIGYFEFVLIWIAAGIIVALIFRSPES